MSLWIWTSHMNATCCIITRKWIWDHFLCCQWSLLLLALIPERLPVKECCIVQTIFSAHYLLIKKLFTFPLFPSGLGWFWGDKLNWLIHTHAEIFCLLSGHSIFYPMKNFLLHLIGIYLLLYSSTYRLTMHQLLHISVGKNVLLHIWTIFWSLSFFFGTVTNYLEFLFFLLWSCSIEVL